MRWPGAAPNRYRGGAVPSSQPKPVQDRFVSSAPETEANPPQAAKSTKTAEAVVPTGGMSAAAAPAK